MGQVYVVVEGRLGEIRLNRPEAINALSPGMIEAITAALTAWRDDPVVEVVLFTGAGERGFCAGGDVRWARERVLAGRPEEADSYFAAEYRMNRMIAEYPKPTVSITHGVVMGGGIGIAGHCRHRFARPGARYGMPETAIGFFADVGVNTLLARAPVEAALLFALSGVSVGFEDARALNLVDGIVEDEGMLRAALREGRIPEAVASASQGEFMVMAGALVATSDAAGFLEQVAELPGLAKIAMIIERRSPIAIVTNWLTQLAVREDSDLGRCLRIDQGIAEHMIRQPDFAEGVRAVLVDKDGAACWAPATVEAVDATGIAEIIASVPPGSRFPLPEG